MFPMFPGIKVYLAIGTTDLRKSINGLSMLVADYLELDASSDHLFAFCNRNRDMITNVIDSPQRIFLRNWVTTCDEPSLGGSRLSSPGPIQLNGLISVNCKFL